MLLRDRNLYLCRNKRVRLIHHHLFCTSSPNPLHPLPLADPSLLSGIASQLLVLHMSLRYWVTASNISTCRLQNTRPFLQHVYLVFAGVMMWLITASFIPTSTASCIPFTRVPFPQLYRDALGCRHQLLNTVCSEVKMGRTQGRHIHWKPQTEGLWV